MLNRQEIIETLRNELPYLNENFYVKRIGLFGSYAKNTHNQDSDIDLLIELEKPIGFEFFSLINYLESELGKKVEIMTKAGFESIRVKEVADSIKRDLIYA